MGGSGSGRHADVYDFTVEDSLTLNINWLRRNDSLFAKGISSKWGVRWSRNGVVHSSVGYETNLGGASDYIRLMYTFRKTESIDYQVCLTKTYPNFGGVRYWFKCPASGCGKRVAKLYSPPGSRYFACRTCQNLTYTSCRESHQFDGLYSRIGADMGRSANFVKRVLKNRR